jgi:hypothetical protein
MKISSSSQSLCLNKLYGTALDFEMDLIVPVEQNRERSSAAVRLCD